MNYAARIMIMRLHSGLQNDIKNGFGPAAFRDRSTIREEVLQSHSAPQKCYVLQKSSFQTPRRTVQLKESVLGELASRKAFLQSSNTLGYLDTTKPEF